MMNVSPLRPRSLLAALLLPVALGIAGIAQAACGDLARLPLGASNATVEKAQNVAASVVPSPPGMPPGPTTHAPAHCRVDGVIGAHTGPDGKRYGIHFALAMPEHWNGRLLYQGGGGLNGVVQPPIGAVAAGDTPALTRGFAVVSSDSGHQGAVFDASFFADQQAALDFLYASIGKVMAVARPLLAVYYGQPARHSYFVGCSTGGREAMIASQRFPQEFDGIIAGSPAMRTSYSNLATRWVTAALNQAAPKDADGNALTAQALPPADRELVVAGLLKQCDAQDGVSDGMIFNTRACNFDPRVLQCKTKKKTDSCLTATQVQAVERAFAGPRTAAGIQVYPGFPYDTGIAYSGPGIPGLLNGGTSPVAPSPKGTFIDVDAEAAAAHNAREMAGDSVAWTNLSAFTAHGGKLLFYHGMSDPWFSALDTVDYYERLTKDSAPRNIADWSRLFLVPGMGHCSGGEATLDRFDLLSAIVDWVEKGQAPTEVMASGDAFPGRRRPLCPYPLHAEYRGEGDTESGESFSCKE